MGSFQSRQDRGNCLPLLNIGIAIRCGRRVQKERTVPGLQNSMERIGVMDVDRDDFGAEMAQGVALGLVMDNRDDLLSLIEQSAGDSVPNVTGRA